MTIQYEKTKATLELLRLDIRESVERLEEILEEIDKKEQRIRDQGVNNGRNVVG